MSLGSIDGYDGDHIRENAWKWKELLHRYFRAQIVGMENCPSRPFVAVGNYSGAVLIPDTLVWLSYYHSSNRYNKPPMLTLAHDAFFGITLLKELDLQNNAIERIDFSSFGLSVFC